MTAADFATVAHALVDVTRAAGHQPPGFRTPPRIVGVDRTVTRRAGSTSAAVAVRIRERPWAAVVADMIDGVIAVNDLGPPEAGRLRGELWAAVSARAQRAVA